MQHHNETRSGCLNKVVCRSLWGHPENTGIMIDNSHCASRKCCLQLVFDVVLIPGQTVTWQTGHDFSKHKVLRGSRQKFSTSKSFFSLSLSLLKMNATLELVNSAEKTTWWQELSQKHICQSSGTPPGGCGASASDVTGYMAAGDTRHLRSMTLGSITWHALFGGNFDRCTLILLHLSKYTPDRVSVTCAKCK